MRRVCLTPDGLSARRDWLDEAELVELQDGQWMISIWLRCADADYLGALEGFHLSSQEDPQNARYFAKPEEAMLELACIGITRCRFYLEAKRQKPPRGF